MVFSLLKVHFTRLLNKNNKKVLFAKLSINFVCTYGVLRDHSVKLVFDCHEFVFILTETAALQQRTMVKQISLPELRLVSTIITPMVI